MGDIHIRNLWLNGQCHENGVAFYQMRCWFRLKQFTANWFYMFTILLTIVQNSGLAILNPVYWLARLFFHMHAILECVTERQRALHHIKITVTLLLCTSRLRAMMTHETAVWVKISIVTTPFWKFVAFEKSIAKMWNQFAEHFLGLKQQVTIQFSGYCPFKIQIIKEPNATYSSVIYDQLQYRSNRQNSWLHCSYVGISLKNKRSYLAYRIRLGKMQWTVIIGLIVLLCTV